MNPHTYQLKRGTALVLVGPQGSGKTVHAQRIAGNHGRFQTVQVGPNFGYELFCAINERVDVLIIDGAPSAAEMARIKPIVTNPLTTIREPYRGAGGRFPSPLVIICSEDPPPKSARRLDVIPLAAWPTTSACKGVH